MDGDWCEDCSWEFPLGCRPKNVAKAIEPKPYVLRVETLNDRDYSDEDQILLHAAFQVLVNYNGGDDLAKYVDFLAGDKVADPAFIADRLPYFKEALSLYNWWTVDRPKRIDPWDARVLGKLTGEEAITEEDRQYVEDTDMLVRLVKIREILWS
jgi:hypothetical protein